MNGRTGRDEPEPERFDALSRQRRPDEDGAPARDDDLDEPFGHLPVPHDGIGGDAEIPLPRVLPVAPPLSADRIPDRYRRSASASVLAASLLGLRDIIEPPDEDEVVIDQHADDDQGTRAIEVYLDPDDPAASLVVIRDPADLN